MLERYVLAAKAPIYVPVMPTPVILPELLREPVQDMTWRRYAFEQAHMTFLEPHRPAGASWQALKRMAFWLHMRRDFDYWISNCSVCHQFRTVGVMAPMRSTLASLDERTKLPWRDVIVDCQGPFTRSAQGYAYTVSYHCTFLGVCKVEPFSRLRK